MKPQSFEVIYDNLFSAAARIVAKGQEPEMMLFGVEPDGALTIVQPMGLPKDMIAFMHRSLNNLYGAAAMVDAAWVHEGKRDAKLEAKLERGELSVRDLPGARTIVLFNIRIGAEQRIAMCEIEKGKLVKGELHTTENMRGRMIGARKGAH